MEATQVKVQIPTAYKELFNPHWRYLVFYGGRASGKSENVARALLLRGRQSQIRVLCTREIQNTIKDSVHKLLKDLIELYGFSDYRVTLDGIVNTRTGSEFLFKGLRQNVNEIKSTQGIDICWVEEAQSVTESSLDILTPTIRKTGSQIIFTFNRFNELDPVYQKFVENKPPRTYVGHVNYDVLQRLNMLPDVILLEIENDRDNPALFAHKWLGEPISQSDLSILSREAVREAMQRTIREGEAKVLGIDVARMGNDRTVFCKRLGLKADKELKIIQQARTTEICDMAEQYINFDKEYEIRVDDTGVGGGVTDELMKRGYNVTPINFGAQANDKEKYPNWISEAWFTFANILDDIELPYNPDLLMELTTRHWRQDIREKRNIESKNDYKKRGFRSPDLADAVIICYADNPKLITVNDIAL